MPMGGKTNFQKEHIDDFNANIVVPIQPKDAKPASESKFIGSILPGFWTPPRRISKDAVGMRLALTHFDTHPSPQNTSRKP